MTETGETDDEDLLKSSSSESGDGTAAVKSVNDALKDFEDEPVTLEPIGNCDSTQNVTAQPSMDSLDVKTAINNSGDDDDEFLKEIDEFSETLKEPENYVLDKAHSPISSKIFRNESIDSDQKLDGNLSKDTLDVKNSPIKEVIDTPMAQSTPIRALIPVGTGPSPEDSKPLIEEELNYSQGDRLDYSILYDDDDENDDVDPALHTITLDQFEMEELDYTILDEEEDFEEENNSVSEQTVIEKKQNDVKIEDVIAAVSASNEEVTAEKKVIPDINNVEKAKPKAKPKPKSIDTKGEYYQKAKEAWKRDMKNYGVDFYIPPIHNLAHPQIFKDQRNLKNNASVESFQEWRDKYHPMWTEYRQCPPNELCNLIFEKWGSKNTIDITRNLTKFSSNIRQKSSSLTAAASKVKVKTKSAKQIHESASYNTTTTVIENANIMDVMLESVRRESSQEADAESNDLTPVSANPSSTSILANCKYCTFRCHCSPGKSIKRPYPQNCPPVVDTSDSIKNSPKLLKLVDIQKEVRNYKTTRMNNEETEARLSMPNVVQNYINEAKDVISSSCEVFNLATYFNGSDKQTNFSREQVRELLSVENTQDTLRKVYKSPYAGEGCSDEESSDDDSDCEIGSVEEEEENDNKEWTDRQIEDY